MLEVHIDDILGPLLGNVPVLVDSRDRPEVSSNFPVSGVIEAEGHHLTLVIEAPIAVVMHSIPILIQTDIGQLVDGEGNLVAVGSLLDLIQMFQEGGMFVQIILGLGGPGVKEGLGVGRGAGHLREGVHEGLIPVLEEGDHLGPLVDLFLEGDGVILLEVGEGDLGEGLGDRLLHRLLLGGLGGGDEGDRKDGGDDGDDTFHC